MPTTTKPRVSRIIGWLRDTWAEVDYAQRRMIELNLAIPPLRPPPDCPALQRGERCPPRLAAVDARGGKLRGQQGREAEDAPPHRDKAHECSCSSTPGARRRPGRACTTPLVSGGPALRVRKRGGSDLVTNRAGPGPEGHRAAPGGLASPGS